MSFSVQITPVTSNFTHSTVFKMAQKALQSSLLLPCPGILIDHSPSCSLQFSQLAFCSLKIICILPPKDLCSFYSLSWKALPSTYLHGLLPHFFQVFVISVRERLATQCKTVIPTLSILYFSMLQFFSMTLVYLFTVCLFPLNCKLCESRFFLLLFMDVSWAPNCTQQVLVKYLLGMNAEILPSVSYREGRMKPRGRATAAYPWGLQMQYHPECFSAGLSSLGDPPPLPSSAWDVPFISSGAPDERAAEPNRGLA